MDLDTLKSRTYSLAELMELHDSLHHDLAEDLRGLDPEVFFAPQGEFWSPAQHLDHLIRCVRPLARALRLPRLLLGLRFGRTTTNRSLAKVVDDYLTKLDGGAVASGPYVPKETDQEASDLERQQELLARWLESGQALTAALSGWRDRDLDRYRIPHPLLGKLTIREMLEWSLYHGHHHWSRIRERSQG